MAYEMEHIALECARCGSNRFLLPNKPPLDTDIVTCAGCGGELGSHGEVIASVRAAGPVADRLPCVP